LTGKLQNDTNRYREADKPITQEERTMKRENIGCAIGQRLFYAFTGHGLTAQQIDDILYPELHAIAADLEKGDWIEFPDGTTATITFKPQKRS